MAYCTTTNLSSRLSTGKIIELCDDERTAIGTTTLAAAIVANANIDTRLTAAITDADAEINRWIRARYKVPIYPVSPSIRLASCRLAIFNLHARRASEFEIPESVTTLRNEALEYLLSISKGEADIGTVLPAASAKAVAQSSSETPKFTATLLENF